MIELSWGAHSDRGRRRPLNEDSFLAEPPLFFVADGMGGHAAGDRASAAVIEALAQLRTLPLIALDDVERAYACAVREVAGLATGADAAGTTISGVAVTEQGGEPYWLVVNIGDSRTYRLAAGVLEQISVDHSEVQELVDRGEISSAEAERHPQRNVITKAVGAGSYDEPDYWFIPVAQGDRIMVCSDGLSKELDAARLAQVLGEEQSAQAAATRLVHEALLHGGRDNVTVVVVDAVQTPGGDLGDTNLAQVPDEDTMPRVISVKERTGDAPIQFG